MNVIKLLLCLAFGIILAFDVIITFWGWRHQPEFSSVKEYVLKQHCYPACRIYNRMANSILHIRLPQTACSLIQNRSTTYHHAVSF